MSPILSTFAGISVYALGFARGGLSDRYFIAAVTSPTASKSTSVATDVNGNILWHYWDTSQYLVGINRAGVIGATNLLPTFNSAVNPGNAVYNPSGQIVAAVARPALGNGYAQPTQINAGTIQWQRSLGVATACYHAILDVDSTGSVYSSMYVNAGWNNTGNVVNVARWNSSGTIQWQRSYTSALSWSKADDMALNNDGSALFVTASYSSSNTPNTSGLLKINSNGTVAWALNNSSSTSGNQGTKVAADKFGNAYVVDKARLAKYNTSGTYQWAVNLPGMNNTNVATDPDGNVYVLMDNGTQSYVAKWNASGTIQWQRGISVSTTPLVISDSDTRKAISATNTAVRVALYQGNARAVLINLPADGSITGAFIVGAITYTINSSAISFTTGSNTFSSLTVTANTTSYTEAANSNTISATSPTYVTKAIP